MRTIEIRGRSATQGIAEAEAVVADCFLGAWGVIDPEKGIFIDEHLPNLVGKSFAGKVLILRGAVGSSGWSMAMHQARINGVAPAAMIYQFTSTRIALGCVVARVPAITDFDKDIFSLVSDGDFIRVNADIGLITVTKKQNTEGIKNEK